MNLNAQQWLMIAVIVAFFIGLYVWTRHEGHKLDRRFHHPPGE